MPRYLSNMEPKARKKLESALYKHTHTDFKGRLPDGTRTVLHAVKGAGTCLVAVKDLSDTELLAKTPRKALEERRGLSIVSINAKWHISKTIWNGLELFEAIGSYRTIGPFLTQAEAQAAIDKRAEGKTALGLV